MIVCVPVKRKNGEVIVFKLDHSDYLNLSRKSLYSWKSQSGKYYLMHNHDKKVHRYIMGNPKSMSIDHINKDTTDNRRDNLRICTHHQNMMNIGSDRGASRYTGVVRVFGRNRKPSGKWRVQINHNGKKINGGTFETEELAAIRYNEMTLKLRGDFAHQNKINKQENLYE